MAWLTWRRALFLGLSLVLLVVSAPCCLVFGLMGGFAQLEHLTVLVVGWGPYLERVVPALGVDWAGTATAAVCVAGLAVGLHLLRLNLDGPDRRPSVTVTVAMVGVVVLAFLAGVAVLSVSHQTGWLITSPEPMYEDLGKRRKEKEKNREDHKGGPPRPGVLPAPPHEAEAGREGEP